MYRLILFQLLACHTTKYSSRGIFTNESYITPSFLWNSFILKPKFINIINSSLSEMLVWILVSLLLLNLSLSYMMHFWPFDPTAVPEDKAVFTFHLSTGLKALCMFQENGTCNFLKYFLHFQNCILNFPLN